MGISLYDINMEALFIDNCTIEKSVHIKNCNVIYRTFIHGDHIKLGFIINESSFSGDECVFNNLTIGYELQLICSTFKTYTKISACLVEELVSTECYFKDLYLCMISTHRYCEFDPNAGKLIDDNGTITQCKDMGPFYEERYDNNQPQKDKSSVTFDNVIMALKNKKSTICFINADFKGQVMILNLKSSQLLFWGCRAFDIFNIKWSQNHGYDEMTGPVQKTYWEQKEREYDLQFISLDDSIFYEDTTIDNVYRFISLSSTVFKSTLNVDITYLNISKGWPVRCISENTRLTATNLDVLHQLLHSISEKDHEGKEELYLDIKTQEKQSCTKRHKIRYVAHELVSNYGKSPHRVIFSISSVICIFAVIIYCFSSHTLADCIIYSCSAFFTIGLGVSDLADYALKSQFILEGALGFILMSYFIVVLCNRRKWRFTKRPNRPPRMIMFQESYPPLFPTENLWKFSFKFLSLSQPFYQVLDVFAQTQPIGKTACSLKLENTLFKLDILYISTIRKIVCVDDVSKLLIKHPHTHTTAAQTSNRNPPAPSLHQTVPHPRAHTQRPDFCPDSTHRRTAW